LQQDLRTGMYLLVDIINMKIFIQLISVILVSTIFSNQFDNTKQTHQILGNNTSYIETNSYYSYDDKIKIIQRENRIEIYRISKNDYKLWDSGDKFEDIDSVLFFDVENDGRNEIILLIWKYGDYLGERDFLEPIRGEDKISQHIYIYNLYPYIHLKWGGSTIRQPILNLEICENNTKLCASESTYDTYPKVHRDIILQWEGWWWDKEYL